MAAIDTTSNATADVGELLSVQAVQLVMRVVYAMLTGRTFVCMLWPRPTQLPAIVVTLLSALLMLAQLLDLARYLYRWPRLGQCALLAHITDAGVLGCLAFGQGIAGLLLWQYVFAPMSHRPSTAIALRASIIVGAPMFGTFLLLCIAGWWLATANVATDQLVGCRLRPTRTVLLLWLLIYSLSTLSLLLATLLALHERVMAGPPVTPSEACPTLPPPPVLPGELPPVAAAEEATARADAAEDAPPPIGWSTMFRRWTSWPALLQETGSSNEAPAALSSAPLQVTVEPTAAVSQTLPDWKTMLAQGMLPYILLWMCFSLLSPLLFLIELPQLQYQMLLILQGTVMVTVLGLCCRRKHSYAI